MIRKSLLGLAACQAISHGPGIIGMLLSRRQPEYYNQLCKPSWSPPAKVFGPVWTLLYTTMGIALWMVWRNRRQPGGRGALALYGTQLALNGAWSPIFFGLRKPRAALYELGVLWVAVAATTWAAARVNRKAGLLLLPYLGWTTFAALLNKRIVDLNLPARPRVPAAAVPEVLSEALG